jgi:hypothetical protein
MFVPLMNAILKPDVFILTLIVTMKTNVQWISAIRLKDVIMYLLFAMIILALLMIIVMQKLVATSFLNLLVMTVMLVQWTDVMNHLANASLLKLAAMIMMHVPKTHVALYTVANIPLSSVMIITNVPKTPVIILLMVAVFILISAPDVKPITSATSIIVIPL